jgi:hypothetical protein
LGLIDRCGFLLGHDGKKEGAAEGLSGEKLEWKARSTVGQRKEVYFIVGGCS